MAEAPTTPYPAEGHLHGKLEDAKLTKVCSSCALEQPGRLSSSPCLLRTPFLFPILPTSFHWLRVSSPSKAPAEVEQEEYWTFSQMDLVFHFTFKKIIVWP